MSEHALELWCASVGHQSPLDHATDNGKQTLCGRRVDHYNPDRRGTFKIGGTFNCKSCERLAVKKAGRDL